jgi:hypothetical protein
MVKKKRLDPESTVSDKRGLSGVIESVFRSFRRMTFFIVLAPMALVYIFCLAAAFFMPLLMLYKTYSYFSGSETYYLICALSIVLPICYFVFAVVLMLVVPLVNFLLPLRLKPMRCTWYSLEVIPWYYHNALVQLVRYTVLDIFTPTPFNILFFRLMGMKIGKNVMINTTNISDPCMIELGDNVTIGGSATLFAHYGMKGLLIVEPTIIKKGSTIGLKASVMGDVVVGDNSMVSPHDVLLPKTRLESTPDPKSKAS